MEPLVNPPSLESLERDLRSALGELPHPFYVIMDGAVFENLPNDLQARSIIPESLFREHQDPAVERAGPWMASIDDTRGLERTLELSTLCSRPFGVFWSCEEGSTALMHHLRTINMVLLPQSTDGGHEAVLFRHWDPNVLAMMLDVLDKEQLREFLGPAQAVVFSAPDFGGLFECRGGGLNREQHHG